MRGIPEIRDVEFMIETLTVEVEGGMERAGGGLGVGEGIPPVEGIGKGLERDWVGLQMYCARENKVVNTVKYI